jgi:hypothetical protein
MHNDPRYVPVAQSLPDVLPAITRAEAEKAATLLLKKFGNKREASARVGFNLTFKTSWHRGKARRCWISSKPTAGHFRGWGRLIHDVSHTVFEHRHPTWRPHDHGHAAVEAEIAQFVAQSGWLDGGLRPAPKKAPTRQEALDKQVAAINARVARWEAKARRAERALKKLRRQRQALARRAQMALVQPAGEAA